VLIHKISGAIHSALAAYLVVLWPWVTQRMTSRALKAGFLLTGCEAKLFLASIFVIVSSSAAGRFTQDGSVSAIMLESLWHRDCTLSQRENSQRGEKIMEIEKVIILLKRVWKAAALTGMVVVTGALLFIFSNYFSYSVFVSNFHHEANAANVAQPR
jgi:hypothetical protein